MLSNPDPSKKQVASYFLITSSVWGPEFTIKIDVFGLNLNRNGVGY